MKLHLGSGKRHIPGWIHVDVIPGEHVDICHSIDRLPMIASDSVEVIYACHVLEHFLRTDVVAVLKEWHRVLIPGGVLRVPVPDFEAIAKLYLGSHDCTDAKVHKGDLSYTIGPLIGGQDGLYDFHYNIFDYVSLTAYLKAAGFSNIRKYDWRETEHAFLDDFSQSYCPHLAKANGMLISLNVEGIK